MAQYIDSDYIDSDLDDLSNLEESVLHLESIARMNLESIPAIAESVGPIPPPSNTLAIGIYMHGAILTDEKGNPVINNNFPEGIHITKQNQGGFGDYTYGITNIHNKPDTEGYAYYRTLNVLNGFETCVDKQLYDTTIKSGITNQQISPELSQQDSCEVFDGLTKYYEKIYAASDGDHTFTYPAIMFMIRPEIKTFGIKKIHINIVNCTYFDLFNFFSSKGKNIVERDRLLEYCIQFVQRREEQNRDIFTTNIFELIDTAAYFLDIIKVNILDESCNVIGAEEGCTGPTSKCKNFKLGMVRDTDIGYGGRHKLKRKSKSKRILKRKSKRKLP